jgi:iduronate 2-sulfatase
MNSRRTVSPACTTALFSIVFAAFAFSLATRQPAAAEPTAKPTNVLFLAVDDLRPELGCYGHPLAKSPNIDRLAAHGVLFSRAYCQQAICSPSRASLMTGLRPDSLGVTENVTYFRDVKPDVVTLPQHFHQHGYETVFVGKIYHGRMIDKEKSWSGNPTFGPRYAPQPLQGYQLPASRATIERNTQEAIAKYGPEIARSGLIQGPVTECADVPDNAYQDGVTADAAVLTLRRLKDKPFFFGVGFHKPHLPFIAPKKYWDLYDPAQLQLADNPFKPKDAPSIGLHASFELRTREGVPKYGPIDDELARHLLHAYLACVSYVDAQIGKVLDELDRLGLRENTVIMLWGDHGWHLGEYGIWGKATNYEIGTRVPLIAVPPGGRDQPAASDALVELLDMYPTLCEMAGLPLPAHLEGRSFAPLIADPTLPGKEAVLSQFPCPALREWAAMPLSQGMRETWFGPLIRDVETQLAQQSPMFSRELYENHVMGYAMRTDRYRLVLWVDTRTPGVEPIAVELYDHQQDPRETVNLAAAEQHAELVQKLTAQIQTLRSKSPKTCREAAPVD